MAEMIFAGFGGQGVMSMGMMVAYAGMIEEKNVSWIPSYGPEMRGGTANCAVVVTAEEIGSPIITEPDVVVAMNLPSMNKFEPMLKPGGLLIYNSSLIEREGGRDDITVIGVPANQLATELGNSRVANMIVMGALLAKTKVVGTESIKKALRQVLPSHRHDLLGINEEAIQRGAEYAK
ncbi:MAG: 2-oxoacid:acceptor oxidoreductase family protein [Bacillota bacterium]|jgi:2-oxoglutarate ferredoxin oxidoreductase subunit gamma|nr:2-oxoacid:ferredoxin oxidoreductase subunit gamma [Bacillota bacterium]HOC05687.1 2-oxoacid:acceptor oxidoreductase family protein [Bacillota bacterium]HPZ22481.1 2-oxoacid:acceptor oxidoreductase family protein [Bacillota bacterium]HQD19245.1 2-oxoacid:acceptor oxidoreductase family protein [Bacillota bacterium]